MGAWGGGGGEKMYITYLSLYCHHQNDFCIKIGSNKSHFNVSLIVRGKVTRECLHITISEEKADLNWAPSAYQPYSLPLGWTGSHQSCYVSALSLSLSLYIYIHDLVPKGVQLGGWGFWLSIKSISNTLSCYCFVCVFIIGQYYSENNMSSKSGAAGAIFIFESDSNNILY